MAGVFLGTPKPNESPGSSRNRRSALSGITIVSLVPFTISTLRPGSQASDPKTASSTTAATKRERTDVSRESLAAIAKPSAAGRPRTQSKAFANLDRGRAAAIVHDVSYNRSIVDRLTLTLPVEPILDQIPARFLLGSFYPRIPSGGVDFLVEVVWPGVVVVCSLAVVTDGSKTSVRITAPSAAPAAAWNGSAGASLRQPAETC